MRRPHGWSQVPESRQTIRILKHTSHNYTGDTCVRADVIALDSVESSPFSRVNQDAIYHSDEVCMNVLWGPFGVDYDNVRIL